MLRRTRSGIRLAGVVLDRRRELGAVGVATWVASRTRLAASTSRSALCDPTKPAGAVFDVIYAIGYWEGEPKRYRVLNPAEGLRAAGYAVHVMPFDEIDDIRHRQWRAKVLVLARAEYDRLTGIERVLAYARGIGMRVVYDIDDLVFDPGLAGRIDGIQLMGPHQRRRFVAALERRRRLMLACDLVTASTAPIARAAAALGRPSAVIPNTLNAAQLRLAAAIAGAPRAACDRVRIGYFSGSRTHRRDFAECEAALFEVMERHDETDLRIVGPLDLGPQWQGFGERIERIGLMSPEQLLRAIADTDINLAPLELGNPFTEGKSELKFFEAAAVGVPTVASPTVPFAAAIEHGVSGFLARDRDEWFAVLEALVVSAQLRRALGEAAKLRALARYGPAVATRATIEALALERGPLAGERYITMLGEALDGGAPLCG
ncbi:MAG TPA: glycosyltransferase family 4 protein [Stellaceae bacterium]|nr:glycosyltransferase family 4 protein [Stellaceae bacterium]